MFDSNLGCSNPSLGSTQHNLWNCGGTLGETSLDFGGSCQGGDMQVSLNPKRGGLFCTVQPRGSGIWQKNLPNFLATVL